ncbi:hypothetical protein GCM10023094_50010 [Rhodococcus olei]|uniref:Uncharacterized protein n=1 Tax=Rhodococcus olei TaxID=2161675 RepID=A0ABP8PP89_9NOCA
MAVVWAIVAAVLVAASAVLWTTRARTPSAERRTRRAPAAAGVLTALVALAGTIVAVANSATATDPAPALPAAFEGGSL